MKQFIKSIIASVFGLITKEQLENELKVKAFNTLAEKTEKDSEDRKALQVLLIEMDIGKPFISVTNEWDNPIVGVVLGVEYNTAGNCPIAHVYDFITNQSVYCGNGRVPYTDLNLDAILKLNPYQHWNLISKSSLGMDKAKYNEDCFSPDEIRSILEDRGFSKVVEELNDIHNCKHTMKTFELIDRVYKVLRSNNLNLEME